MVLHGFASRNPTNMVLRPKILKYDQKPKNMTKNPQNNPEIFQVNIVEACMTPLKDNAAIKATTKTLLWPPPQCLAVANQMQEWVGCWRGRCAPPVKAKQ